MHGRFEPKDTTIFVSDPHYGEAIITSRVTAFETVPEVRVLMPSFEGTCDVAVVSGALDSLSVLMGWFPGTLSTQLCGRGFCADDAASFASEFAAHTGGSLVDTLDKARRVLPPSPMEMRFRTASLMPREQDVRKPTPRPRSHVGRG